MRKLLILALLCPYFSMCQPLSINGKIINQDMEPVSGATITIKRSGATTVSNEKGEFQFTTVQIHDTIIVTAVGYESETRGLNFIAGNSILISLTRKTAALDEVMVIAYGTTTRRLSTGNISKLSADQIQRQPVLNPLAALQGRIPGLVITQSSGVPGASFNLQIRGRNSLTQGTEPLIIIDGIPFAPNNNQVDQLGSAASGIGRGFSPFYSINPADIKSIEVLKDADATAIYGSRGANGVILITTARPAAGDTRFSLSLQKGFSQPTRITSFLNTHDYLQLRREAFNNDNVTPTIYNAPDLMIFDSSRYTNFKSIIFSNHATQNTLNAGLSGGSENTRFSLAGTYNNESALFSDARRQHRYSLHSFITHQSNDHRLILNLTTTLSSVKNSLLSTDISNYLISPPNLPGLYDSLGQLTWEYKGSYIDNPLAYLHTQYDASTYNILINTLLSYKITNDLVIKTSLGYNNFRFNEVSTYPAIAQNPLYNPTGSSQFANRQYSSWSAEPYLQFQQLIAGGALSSIIGMTFNENSETSDMIIASGYTSDALLRSLAAGAVHQVNNNASLYRYASLFGRVGYSIHNRYIMNLTGRRDASSRFGPGKQSGTFGSAAIAWIFSNEKLVQLPFLSFGKLRFSYGSSGNDQIGNYQYLDSWSGNLPPYNGNPVVVPARLYNPDFSWEVTRKLEAATDLAFFSDRYLFSAAWFCNKSSNQLVQYALPAQTGFSTVLKNFPAVIENSGWEFSATANWIKNPALQWSTSVNITLPRNRLASFPGIESSSYGNTYKVGESLSLLYNLHYRGIDSSGVYQFEDLNKDGILDTRDFSVNGDLAPRYYGGVQNEITWKGLSLDMFFEFRKSLGRNFLYWPFNGAPGIAINLPTYYLDRFPAEGASLQKVSVLPGAEAARAQRNMNLSDGTYSDASFMRLKNLALSYSMNERSLNKVKLKGVRISLLAQNLLTITSYEGADPEVQSAFILPPLKTIVFNINITL